MFNGKIRKGRELMVLCQIMTAGVCNYVATLGWVILLPVFLNNVYCFLYYFYTTLNFTSSLLSKMTYGNYFISRSETENCGYIYFSNLYLFLLVLIFPCLVHKNIYFLL